MTESYTEKHHLVNGDADDGTNVLVVLHLQGVTMARATGFVNAVLTAAREHALGAEPPLFSPGAPATHYEPRGAAIERETIIRPQTSGPCVHYDDRSEHAVDADPCTYPYGDGTCPHLDNPDVLCPVKDACYAMRDITRRREACEAEQDEQDADMAAVAPPQTYEAAAPEFVEPEPEEAPTYTTPARPKGRAPAHLKEWTAEEDAAIRPATTAAESVTLYRSAVPDSGRSDAAIRTQWYKKVRPGLAKTRDSHPDFVGDVVSVTQCEEPPEGITYGDAPEHPPETEVAAAFDKKDLTRHPWIGMRVRILDPPDLQNMTGVVHRYNSDSREMLVALDDAPDRIWCPPESLLLIGAGRRSP